MSEGSTDEKVAKIVELLRTIGQPALDALTWMLPFMVDTAGRAYKFWKQLPYNVAQVIIGLIFCFFGGLYPTLFAAIQAIKVGGYFTLKESLQDLYEEVMIVLEANKKDNAADEDKDGKADVKEIDHKAFILRKTNLILTKINPQKIDRALASIYKIWASVLVTLTIQFARTIALAVTIADAIRKPVHKYIEPILVKAVPKGYERWVPVVTGWVTKSIAMSFAWYLQSIISAASSALEGSALCAQALLQILIERGITLRGLVTANPNDTYIDEIFSAILAATGFYFQFSIGFDIQFPYNIPLMPFEISESYLRWTVTNLEQQAPKME